MKREYIIFAAVLAAILVVWIISRSCVSSSERKSQAMLEQAADRRALDELKGDFEASFARLDSLIDQRLDSLERHYREYVEPFDSSLDSLADIAAPDTITTGPNTIVVVETVMVVDTFVAPPETVEVTLKSEEQKADIPTETEIRIYNRYLKKRWALPTDLTRYESKIAKADIHTELGEAFGLSAKKIAAIVEKVYEFRKRDKGK
ncbi:MAG: hypothetical protein KAT58_03110 [candidate division Zixibacteria bacterium]|nr:hypothetical protein [candidate division Zixibacteria bacterium]